MPHPSLTRILYVEDETDMQMVARLALENIGGFTLKICSSGREALEAVSTWTPDLILLDVMMPEMDGPATLQRLRALPAAATTPVIFMTAKAQPREVASFKAMGALDVVTKPFDPMTLADTISSIWENRTRE